MKETSKVALFLAFAVVTVAVMVTRFVIPTQPPTLLGAYKDFAHLWVAFLFGIWIKGQQLKDTEGYDPGEQSILLVLWVGLLAAELVAVAITLFQKFS